MILDFSSVLFSFVTTITIHILTPFISICLINWFCFHLQEYQPFFHLLFLLSSSASRHNLDALGSHAGLASPDLPLRFFLFLYNNISILWPCLFLEEQLAPDSCWREQLGLFCLLITYFLHLLDLATLAHTTHN